MITVFGHRDADWDSVAAAIGAAHWLSQQGKAAAPAVVGSIPIDIDRCLNNLQIPLPQVLTAPPAIPFLVDHNHPAESFADMAEPIGIIDHHSFLNLSSQRILFCRVEPLGSTSTLVAKMYFEKGLVPPKKIAYLLGLAIVSDTRAFKSTRTTPEDLEVFEKLASISEITLRSAMDLVLKPTPLEGKSLDEILMIGRKEYPLRAGTIGISYLDIVDDLPLLPQLLKRMKTLPYLLYALMIVNLQRGTTEVYFTQEARLSLAFPEYDGDRLFFDQIVARNHVLLPHLKRIYNE